MYSKLKLALEKYVTWIILNQTIYERIKKYSNMYIHLTIPKLLRTSYRHTYLEVISCLGKRLRLRKGLKLVGIMNILLTKLTAQRSRTHNNDSALSPLKC